MNLELNEHLNGTTKLENIDGQLNSSDAQHQHQHHNKRDINDSDEDESSGLNEIIPRLYLSSDFEASKRDLLKSKNITHIVNVTMNVPNRFQDEIAYKKIQLYDGDGEEASTYFDESYNFIEDALKIDKNSVLVHCNAGVSRSPTVVIAYLMQKGLFKTYKEAFEYVKQRRSIISPNECFINQLKRLEQKYENEN